MDAQQPDLFSEQGANPWPEGWRYANGFLSVADEAALLAMVAPQPLAPARYKAYTARREVLSFGGRFDYDRNELLPGDPVPEWLFPLRRRVARWLGVTAAALEHALVARYAPGTPLGWHRDVPDFEAVAGVSLGSAARLRFRPFPHVAGLGRPVLETWVEPRSIYALQGPARWDWQHSVPAVEALRWSITFRTRRGRAVR